MNTATPASAATRSSTCFHIPARIPHRPRPGRTPNPSPRAERGSVAPMESVQPPYLTQRFRASRVPLFVFVPVAAACALAAVALPFSPSTLDFAMLASWSVTTGLTFWGSLSDEFVVVRDPSRPAPQEPARRGEALALVLSVVFGLGGFASLLAFTGIDIPPGHVDALASGSTPVVVNMSLASAVMAVGAVVAGLSLRRMMERDMLRAVASVLDSAPLTPASRPGERVHLHGVVRDPTPVASPVGPAAFAITSDVEEVPGSDPNIERGNLANDRTFYIVGADAAVELDPRGVLWTPGERLRWHARAPSGNTRKITVDYLPVDAPVLVAGVLRAGARSETPGLAATPEVPVVLMRPGAGDDPFATLRAVRRRSRLAQALLAAHLVLTAAVAVALANQLPPWHAPESDGKADND